MSTQFALPRFAATAVASAACLIATVSMAGTINYTDPLLTASPYIKFHNVREEWNDSLNESPDPVLTPPDPSVSLFANGTGILFAPQNFAKVETTSTNQFDLKTKATTLRINAQGQSPGIDPGILGYALNDVTFTIGGDLTVWAPLSTPAQPFDSYAQANVAAQYTVILKQVNWANVQEITFTDSMPLELVTTANSNRATQPTISVEAFGPGPKDFYTWNGNLVLTQSMLKSMFNITDPEQYVTEAALAFATNISVVGVYGEGYVKVNNVGVSSNSVAVQPVPEPPTVILAGLGAAAVVGSGWRRKVLKRKSNDGAVALSA